MPPAHQRSPYQWLYRHRAALQARSPQAAPTPWIDENRTAYSRRQNLERFAQPKILVRCMVEELNAPADPIGDAGYFVNVSTGGYGFQLPEGSLVGLEYLASLLNSELPSWMLRRSSRAFRGGWMGARAENPRQLPVAGPDSEQQQAVVDAYDSCRHLAAESDAAVTDGYREQLARLYAAAVSPFDRLGLRSVRRRRGRTARRPQYLTGLSWPAAYRAVVSRGEAADPILRSRRSWL